MIKEGGIFKDGLKQKVLTSANVSRLFGIHSQIKKISGYYYGVNVG
jgi:ABC-type cobalamin/Fe3+-siderophores transport system ATPase subunit